MQTMVGAQAVRELPAGYPALDGGPDGAPAAPAVALSAHARTRCAQRGIALGDLERAIEHGRVLRNAGARFVLFGRREVEEACAGGADRRAVERLRGLVVLLDAAGGVITAYRNARATADIRKKRRYDRRRPGADPV